MTLFCRKHSCFFMCKSCYSHPNNSVNVIIYKLQNQVTFNLASSQTGRRHQANNSKMAYKALKATIFVVLIECIHTCYFWSSGSSVHRESHFLTQPAQSTFCASSKVRDSPKNVPVRRVEIGCL